MKATYIDHMGTDLSVVNAAKVSFDKRSEWLPRIHTGEEKVLSKKDQILIQFLARGCTSGDWANVRHKVGNAGLGYVTGLDTEEDLEGLLTHIRKIPSHWSPFAHTAITLHLKMPIFVARQIMLQTKDIDFSEMEFDSEPEFYVPELWRKKSDEAVTNLGDFTNRKSPEYLYGIEMKRSITLYNRMIDGGVAPEQARMVLPQSMYTEVIATGNLYAWANMYIQRSDSHAQKETQDLAKQIVEIIQPLYPVSWEALTA
jgi:thymidylate synthase (FAD)